MSGSKDSDIKWPKFKEWFSSFSKYSSIRNDCPQGLSVSSSLFKIIVFKGLFRSFNKHISIQNHWFRSFSKLSYFQNRCPQGSCFALSVSTAIFTVFKMTVRIQMQQFKQSHILNTVVYRTVVSNGICDSVRPVIANLGFVFQVDHRFILVFLLFLITACQC